MKHETLTRNGVEFDKWIAEDSNSTEAMVIDDGVLEIQEDDGNTMILSIEQLEFLIRFGPEMLEVMKKQMFG